MQLVNTRTLARLGAIFGGIGTYLGFTAIGGVQAITCEMATKIGDPNIICVGPGALTTVGVIMGAFAVAVGTLDLFAEWISRGENHD
jgi:hypothetical protein